MRKLSLNGTWQILSADGTFQLCGEVPTSFFLELERAGHWGAHDVFYRENNRRCIDLANRAVKFSRTFALPAEMRPGVSERVMLEADGIDTVGTVRVNGKHVGQTNNMHRRYCFDVGAILKDGENQVQIDFANIMQVIADADARRSLWQVGAPVRGANHVRKMFCSFGWDWGPQIPDTGIYRDIRLVSYKNARIEDLHITQTHEDGRVVLTLTPRIDVWTHGKRHLQVQVTGPDGSARSHRLPTDVPAAIVIENPELWWPNGYGKQPLYLVHVNLVEGDDILHSVSQRIGLRTLRLEREKDEWGESFQFNCNGVPLFARGANYVPQDVYLNRVTSEQTRRLIQACAQANFNCVRVWGGGIYPDDSFYDCCDEFGIVVWQDLMFACAIYDIHSEDFQRNIELEIRDVLQRIRHHACLGLLCGNNEMEWAFEAWNFPHTKENRVEYIKQYEVLFPSIVKEICSEIDYWPASPSSGGYFDEPNSDNRGDVHDWTVWHGRKPYTEFRQHTYRFLSEFGFQSFPDIKTIHTYTAPEDRNIFSPVMEDHQRNEAENGNGKIMHYIAEYYRHPKDLESIVYVSQASQAECVRYAIEHLRQNRGRCMGTTYWQLNDNWPTASWASIDYFGRWKGLHYCAKRCYDPVLVSIRESRHAAELHLTNDRRTGTRGTVQWRLLTLDGTLLKDGRETVAIPPLTSRQIVSLDLSEDLAGLLARNRYLSVVYEDDADGSLRYATACFVAYKQLDLQAPELQTQVLEQGGELLVQVRATRSFAKFVVLSLNQDDVVFSDNWFDLDAGQERCVRVNQTRLSRTEIERQLCVHSLVDSYR